jgi:hypothetical protein
MSAFEGKADMTVYTAKCPLMTQSGHRHAKGLSYCPKTETDPTKRAMEARLLAEEELKQKHLPAYDKKETKAY